MSLLSPVSLSTCQFITRNPRLYERVYKNERNSCFLLLHDTVQPLTLSVLSCSRDISFIRERLERLRCRWSNLEYEDGRNYTSALIARASYASNKRQLCLVARSPRALGKGALLVGVSVIRRGEVSAKLQTWLYM